MGGQGSGGWLQYAIPFAVFAVIFALRWKRAAKERPLRLERLWVFPALYAVVATVLLATRPPVGWIRALCAVALVVGAGLGWVRGRMMRITVDPATHALNHAASPAAILFVLGLVVVRQSLRLESVDHALGLDALAITDIAIALGLGLFTTQRLEMYLRGRRLLAGVR